MENRKEQIDRDDVISTINGLIETCKDGEDGFRRAAHDIQNGELKTLFGGFSQQRARFAGELQNEVLRLGGDPERKGSSSGALHRGWMKVREALTGRDDHAIIAECERGEDSAVKNYQEAMEKKLPQDLREIVERQFRVVKETHDQVRALEKARHA